MNFDEKTKELITFCKGYKVSAGEFVRLYTKFGEEEAMDVVKFCYKNSINVDEYIRVHRMLEIVAEREDDERKSLSASE